MKGWKLKAEQKKREKYIGWQKKGGERERKREREIDR